ncbi:LPXTG cell wall anchor domain-containing protein [Sphingomonas sp.]|uniref:LPXTG cell wall anchor domain-containing protein n=1 Tax=Sphingomonas sp. TaxID=28214 RepID=UPI002E312662|nr:LPXTG cell wall anchor domain-containing protein [Sphingomonas sp.]HEX4693148.1 LPXTG cell wall anchor domain-containing protein [Sphingomonas sp.]
MTATATPTPAATESATPQPVAAGWSSSTTVAIVVAMLALLAAAWFLFGRRRNRDEDIVEETPEPVAAEAPPEPGPLPAPSGHITIPARRRALEENAPRIEVTLVPRRAGTNLTGAAVDYRVTVRNTGTIAARDIRVSMYMLSASARQVQDLQQIFAAAVDQPAVPPFELAPGGEIVLSGIAQLPREQINVMTIEGRPWFVPVLAMKAEYRWGENVGAPGVATAAHMIGIDRGEGAKMAPFRLDGNPRMHAEVAERKVA